MEEEFESLENQEEEKVRTGLPLKWLIIAGAGAIVISVAVILFLVLGGAGEEETPDEPPAEEIVLHTAPHYESSFSSIYVLDNFIIELIVNEEKRELEFKAELELDTEETIDEVIALSESVNLVIRDILSVQSLNNISDISGKLQLKNEIIKRVNGMLQTGRVRNIYITNFIVHKKEL